MKIKALKDKWMPSELLIFFDPLYCIILNFKKRGFLLDRWKKSLMKEMDMDTNSNSEADGTGGGE